MYNPYSELVYALHSSYMRTVFIDEKIIVEDSRVLAIDERATLAKAQEYKEDQ
jgi:cytosine/adenosine deaminase-related metal-dependent hydrolase